MQLVANNGRPPLVLDVLHVRSLLKSNSLVAAARELGVHRNTLYRRLRSDPVWRECITRPIRPRYPSDTLRQLRELSEAKPCSSCHELKSLGAFQFLPLRGAYRGQCKTCVQKRWNLIQKSRRSIQDEAFKTRKELLYLQTYKYDALTHHDTVSLDAPIKSDGRRELTLHNVVADPTPNVLERMLASEGIERVIQRLADEKQIPVSQSRAIVEALVDGDMLADESVYNLADTLRGAWQADRLLARITKPKSTRYVRPSQPNPTPHDLAFYRKRYALHRSGRILVGDTEPVRFGGSWSIESVLPEELRAESEHVKTD